MKQLELIHKINKLFSVFVTEIKGLNSLNLYDINIISEYILIPLFKEIFQYSDLKNVNDDNKNYPGIDLADDTNKVAFQVTSTPSSTKIKNTLHQFFKYELENKYDRLYCYILTEKQKSYTFKNEGLEQSRFNFSVKRDIIDYTDLLKEIQGLKLEKINRVASILEKQFSVTEKIKSSRQNSEFEDTSDPWKLKYASNETLCSNLLEITFPKKLYIAYLDFNRKEVIKASRHEGGSFLKNSAPTRQVVREALKQKGFRFANDWTCHENKLITFHDLNNSFIPLLQILDEGTIEEFTTEDFFLIDSDHENVFKGLLHLCLQRYLYQKKVEWKHEDRMFVFMPDYGELKKREIDWHSKISATRTVFEIYPNKKTDGIYYCKHLAFKTFYRRYEEKWFIEIIPNWYITYDGYRRSAFGAEKIKWLKRQERNQHVFNHLRFIVYFIKEKEQQIQIVDEKPIPQGFLDFHKLVTFVGHPFIGDKDWNRNEEKERQKKLLDPQQPLFSDF